MKRRTKRWESNRQTRTTTRKQTKRTCIQDRRPFANVRVDTKRKEDVHMEEENENENGGDPDPETPGYALRQCWVEIKLR
jgi:hypothetical protein